MAVQALGYIGIGAADLDAWSDFATRQLGLQQVDGGAARRSGHLFPTRCLGIRGR